jgi:streptogramin lyase
MKLAAHLSLAVLWGATLVACSKSPSSGLDDGTDGSGEASADGEAGGVFGSSTTALDGSGNTGAVAPKYDVGAIPDAPPPLSCNGRGGGGSTPGEPLYSYIWISNSSEGTVSKIDTVELVELGRYRTHPEFGDPSRTSVSLNGDVAVANRNGGVAKFHANPADCEDRNGNGVVDTSSGPGDVLAWDVEECRAWFTPFEYTSQRPVAWTSGQWDPDDCRYENEKVWTAGASDNFEGGGAIEGVRIVQLDGDTGAIEHVVKILEVIPNFYGIYGGAVDAQNNFWGSQLGIGDLVRVDAETFEFDVWPMQVGGYGMTVDSAGYVWTCAYEVGRFDPDTETWQTASVGGAGGCMEDGQGTLWLANSPLVGVDIETLQVVATHQLPDYVHGVSIDFQGFVWGVSMNTSAYRVDPRTGAFDIVSGLTGPYTYSDMTGFALANAGGWTPAG